MPARLIGPRRQGGAFYKKRPLTVKPRVKLTKGAGVAVTKAVKKVLHREEEVKHVGQNVVDAAFNYTISASSECYRLLPDVSVGTDGHQRIGDKIRPKYLIVKGHLQWDTLQDQNVKPPATVRIMILTQKNLKLSSDVASRVDVSHLLKDNIGTDVARPYTSTMFDNLAPINKDLFNVLMDRKIKLRAMQYFAGVPPITIPNNYTGTQRTITFYKKIKCPASLFFDDGNGNVPNNFAPFICMGAVSDDNSGGFTLGAPLRLTVQSELYFTDS